MAKLTLFPYFVNSRKTIQFLCKLYLNTIVNKLSFCIKYTFRVVWMCGPYWAVLRMYKSHDMRHTDFPRVDGGQRDTPVLGRHRGPH